MKFCQRGYVSLEFALAMGLLVLPTALILLEIPPLLEKHNRVESISALVANDCANNAQSISQANQIARESASKEANASISLKNAKLVSATCSFENGNISHGAKVTSQIVFSIPAAIIPGTSYGKEWQVQSHHVAITPKYRSIDE